MLIDCALFSLIKISISIPFPVDWLVSPSLWLCHCYLSLCYNYAYGFTLCSCLLRCTSEYTYNQRLCFKDNQYRCPLVSLNIVSAHTWSILAAGRVPKTWHLCSEIRVQIHQSKLREVNTIYIPAPTAGPSSEKYSGWFMIMWTHSWNIWRSVLLQYISLKSVREVMK